MFLELLDKDNEFYTKFLRSFSARSACSSIGIESDDDEFDFSNSILITNYMDAFDYTFSLEEIRSYNLLDIIKLLTDSEYDNYRKTDVMVNGSNRKRCLPRNIRMEILNLFDNYNNVWSLIEDPYLKEAFFHIKFLMIHPFGDGNGRMARLITSYNLCNNSLAPIIITKNEKKEYCKYIENYDYQGLANLFRRKSMEELKLMIRLFKQCETIDYTNAEKVLKKRKDRK